MKFKFFLVLVLLFGEAAYAGRMLLHTKDSKVIETVTAIPVFGDFFYEYRIKETRERATSGDVHEMMVLFFLADAVDRSEDRALALDLLEESGTATGELFLAENEGRPLETESSRDAMLLIARAMKENIRPYIPDGDQNAAFTQQSREYARDFQILQSKAESGDGDAVWVMHQIGLTADGQPIDTSGVGS